MFLNLIRISIFALALAASFAAKAYTASYYTPVSQLSEGRWVKVDIDTTGVYEVSYEQLRAWGFDTPEKVNVYGYGSILGADHTFNASYPDDLQPTSSYHTADGRLLFYGEGPVRATMSTIERISVTRNVYDRYGHYFLSDIPAVEQGYERRPYVPYTDNTLAVRDWHYSLQLVENEVQNTGEGGYIYHDRKMSAGERFTIPFHIKNFGWSKTTKPKGIFAFQAGINNPESLTITMALSSEIGNVSYSPQRCNGNSIPTRLFVTAQGAASFYETDTKPLTDTHFTATLTIPNSFTGPYAAIDYGYIIYPRFSRIGTDSELSLYFRERDFRGQNFCVDDADEDVQVWNVTSPHNILRYELSYDAEQKRAVFTIGDEFMQGHQRIVAFNPSARHRTPRCGVAVNNQNLHGCETPYLFIVTTKSLYTEASELAEIHRRYGHDVVVAVQDDIFNEFGSGTRSPAAIRRMAKMFYDRDPERIAHILLYGCSTWDNRFLCTDERDVLVNFECEVYDQARDGATNYASDQYFGMVGDSFLPLKIHDQPAQMSVGRLSVSDSFSARIANAKVEKYFKTPPPASAILRALKSSDDGDDGVHFTHAEFLADTLLNNNADITVIRADNLLFPFENGLATEASTHIEKTLQRGVGFFYYTGHGDSHSVTAEKLWTNSMIKSIEYSYPPVAMMSSCDAYPFDRHPNTLAETMTMQPDGGMIGTIAACRSVYLDHNKPLSLAIAEAYATARPGTTGADLLMNARNLLISRGMSANLGFNTLCYNYCGDPALPLSLPTFRINGDGFGAEQVPYGEPVSFNATVADLEGGIMDAFNGMALIEVYDAPTERTTFKRYNDDGKQKTVLCDENLLAEYSAEVKDGRISLDIILPEPASEGKSFRVVVSALDDLSGLSAAGSFRGSSIVSSENPVEASAPSIIEFRLSDDSMADANTTKTDITVLATIDPSKHGLAVGNSGIRSNLTVTLDGKTQLSRARSILSYDADGTAHFELPIKDLSFGRHTVELRAVSNAGLYDEASISFVTGTAQLEGTLTVEGEGPVREEAVFNCDTDARVHRIIIVDKHGKTVHSATDAALPYHWNLTDNSGHPVADGQYKAHAILESDISLGATTPVEFIVLKK